MNKKMVLTFFVVFLLLVPLTGRAATQEAGNDTAGLLLHLQKHISAASPEAAQSFNQAVELLQKGNVDGALAKLEAAMEQAARHPAFGALYAAYRQIIADNKKFERAVAFFQRLVLATPKVADVHAALGSAYGEYIGAMYASGEVDHAKVEKFGRLCLEEYEVGLRLDENSFSARLGRGIYLTYVPGRFEEALKDFQKLFDMEASGKFSHYPFDVAYFFLGDAYKRTGQTEKAKETWQAGLKRYPNSPMLKKALAGL
jgi:tetratricopeptide (TPR) repeat protein